MEELNGKINNLKEGIICEEFNIKHFQKEMNNYYSNVVCYEFSKQNDLIKSWKEAVNNVAINVQAKLKKNIEIYNIYILFFCKGVNNEIINIIEQNKYSSRKIVINTEMPKDRTELEMFINKKLFEFDLEKKQFKNNSIKEIISDESISFLRYLEDKDNIDEYDLEEIINFLGIKIK